VNQFSVSRGGTTIRPDVTLFVNGIPLVTMELKSLAQDNDYYDDAISDLHDYEEDVPRLFVPGLFNVAADTTGAALRWCRCAHAVLHEVGDAPPEYADDNGEQAGDSGAMQPRHASGHPQNFVFYERRAGGDAKIVPRYMRYYAVNEILDRVAEGEPSYEPEEGTLDRGLIWHTQGSGKSYTMLYAAENLLSRPVLNTPQVFVIVDTDKLASQMRDTLANIGFEQSVVAEVSTTCRNSSSRGQSGLVLTTIQKFQDVEPNTQGNDEVVVLTDKPTASWRRTSGAVSRLRYLGTSTSASPGRQSGRVRRGRQNTFREFSLKASSTFTATRSNRASTTG